MSEALDNLKAAKVRSSLKHPYLITAMYAMRLYETTAIPTLGVDKFWNCYFNPNTVNEWTVEVIATVLEHEVWHLLRRHHERMPLVGAQQSPWSKHEIKEHWNVATDCEINDDLMKTGQLPDGVCYPTNFGMKDGLIAEEYYDGIPLAKSRPYFSPQCGCPIHSPGNTPGKGGNQDAEDGSGTGDERGDGGAGTGDKPGSGNGQGKQDGSGNQAGQGSGQCTCGKRWGGSCADGVSRPWESEGDHISPIEKELIAKEVARKIKEHTANRGTVPAGMVRWADDQLKEPIVPWNKELASIIRGHLASLSGYGDITYSRRHRRQSIYGNVIKAAPYRLIPQIVVVVDTSGSVSDDMLTQALTETHHILRVNEGLGVTVMSCDAAVGNVQKVFSRKQVTFKGGGGTDMCEGLRVAVEKKPQVIILITDGYTPYPKDAPDSKIRFVTLVLCEGGGVPTFGKVVKVGKDNPYKA